MARTEKKCFVLTGQNRKKRKKVPYSPARTENNVQYSRPGQNRKNNTHTRQNRWGKNTFRTHPNPNANPNLTLMLTLTLKHAQEQKKRSVLTGQTRKNVLYSPARTDKKILYSPARKEKNVPYSPPRTNKKKTKKKHENGWYNNNIMYSTNIDIITTI